MRPLRRQSADWPLLRETDRDGFISWVQIEAEDHQPEQGGGCTCGFCAWSVDHVLTMAIREVWDFRAPPPPADDTRSTAQQQRTVPTTPEQP